MLMSIRTLRVASIFNESILSRKRFESLEENGIKSISCAVI